jgi:hypothetical protein
MQSGANVRRLSDEVTLSSITTAVGVWVYTLGGTPIQSIGQTTIKTEGTHDGANDETPGSHTRERAAWDDDMGPKFGP